MTAKLIMMCGFPGAGKSTKAKSLAKEFDAVLIELDALAVEGTPGGKMPVDRALRIAGKALSEGENVVYDTINPTAESRKQFVDLAVKAGAEAQCVYMRGFRPETPEFSRKAWLRFFDGWFEDPKASEGFAVEIIDEEGE